MAFSFLLLCSILFGAAAGLLFVYKSDLPEVRALEDYRPDVVTELYADDGQPLGSFALQRRILLTYEQIPRLLRDAVIVTEDQHFEEHWGVDFPRVLEAAWQDIIHHGIQQGASTLTMQLAGGLFLNRSDRSFRRKIQETMLAIQIERHYTKEQILTMYCNQIYLGHGNYGFQAASEFYFGKPVAQLTIPEAALLAGIVRGPSYSPILHPQRALARRNLVLVLLEQGGRISKKQEQEARGTPLGLHLQYARNDIAPYFIEEVRQYLEHTYGTEAVHEQGLRVYTTLNLATQRAARQAVADGLHTYDRRHGWRGHLTNILADPHDHGRLDSYESEDWRDPITKGAYVTGLVTAVSQKTATVKVGPYRATLSAPDFAWTGRKSAADLVKPGDLVLVHIEDITGSAARIRLDQHPVAQGALVAIESSSGEIKAMVGGYSFKESKFNRAIQAERQAGSSFKIYLYAAAIEQGHSPFETISDSPLTVTSGGKPYSPHNYDGRFEGRITLRRALAASRNVAAVRLAMDVRLESVVEMAKRFGITTALPPFFPLVLGAADVTLLEHTSAFTVFSNDGVRVEPHMIRRVSTYDGAVLEEAHPKVYDVLSPDVARTMTAMLEDVVLFGTAVRAKELARPLAGKTGTTQDWTDAWFLGFSPSLTAGVWVGNDDKRITLGKGEQGARAALPIWMDFMKGALEGKPVEQFKDVVPLEKQAAGHLVQVDTPDTAPAEAGESGRKKEATTPEPPSNPATPKAAGTAPSSPGQKP